MRHSSGRGQVEPLAALVAVLAVSVGLTVYAGALDDVIPDQPASETPEAVLEGVDRSLSSAGVTHPTRLDAAMATVPDGWHANVTLTAAGRQWQRGPTAPSAATRERRRVSIRVAPQRIVAGQLRVVVWR